jgi:hypothetical protein
MKSNLIITRMIGLFQASDCTGVSYSRTLVAAKAGLPYVSAARPAWCSTDAFLDHVDQSALG